MTTVKPLRNKIMFQFLDETGGAKGKFSDRKTQSGIILARSEMAQKAPRWGKVIAVGPEAGVAVGEYILIEALMWTFGTEIDGVKMWSTDDTKILMVTDDEELTNRAVIE